jgi:hypothetical protein
LVVAVLVAVLAHNLLVFIKEVEVVALVRFITVLLHFYLLAL